MALEKVIQKNLNEAIKIVINNESTDSKESFQSIIKSFEELISLYFKDSEWQKISSLIEKIILVLESCSETENIGQDYLELALGNFFYKIDKNFLAYKCYKRGKL